METVETKGYRKPSQRLLGLRMDKELEAALEASAAKSERTLAQEARYGLKMYLGLKPASAGDVTSESA